MDILQSGTRKEELILPPDVLKAVTLLREEVSRNMAMLGVNTLAELDASYLLPARP